MNRARSAVEVAEAWTGISGPYMQIVAADTEGHILQQLAGAVPVRQRGAGRLPAPGADSRWEWSGFRQMSTRLRRLDPAEGFVAAANHDPFAEGDYPPSLAVPGEFASPWRVRRIRRALAMRDDWGVRDSLELQSDVASGLAVALLAQLRTDLEAHGGESAAVLMEWDGRMAVDSRAAHVFSALLIALGAAIGDDEAAQVGLTSSPIGSAETLRLMAGGLDAGWWDDVSTQDSEDRDTVIRRVLDELDALGLEAPWGRVHRASFKHPFSAAPVFGRWFGRSWSRGPFPVGGDAATVNAHYWQTHEPFEVAAIPSARFVTDVGSWDETILVLPVGQSGRPWSPHYADQIKPWLYVEPLMLPFSREAVDAAAVARLILLPKPEQGDADPP
jgi:penicillin amidase